MCKKGHILIFFFMRERRREMSNFSEVATKFLTVNLHKTVIPTDLIHNFRGLKGLLSTVMLFVVS